MKILFVGDSPKLHTGFATVLRKIAVHVADNTNWHVKYLGWYDKRDSLENLFPFELIVTDGTVQDVYGQKTFNSIVQSFRPDVVFAIGDEWMIRHLTESPYRDSYKLIIYTPIDGAPIPMAWVETFRKADSFVCYTDWAKKVIHHRDNTLPISIIPHGLDCSIFKKQSNVERVKPFNKDSFVIGCVGRNQPRKNLPAFIKMMSVFLAPWLKCYECNSIAYMVDTVQAVCPKCQSENCKVFPRKENVYGYMHCSLDDCGWDLGELIERFGLRKNIVFPKNNTVGGGVSDERMSHIYNMMDVFTLPTTGEGWGLPIMEAMACGLPCLVTNYSAHLDYCNDCTEKINVGYYNTEPKWNIERALVDVDDYVMKMDRLYYDKDTFITKYAEVLFRYGITDFTKFLDGSEIRKNLGLIAGEKAKLYDWSNILPMWMELLKKFETEDNKKVELKLEKM